MLSGTTYTSTAPKVVDGRELVQGSLSCGGFPADGMVLTAGFTR